MISHLQRYFQLCYSLLCLILPEQPFIKSLPSFFSFSGSEALLYHLSEVKGMSLWKQKFEPLGLDSEAIEGISLYPVW